MHEPSRYHRQTLLPGIGDAGQRRLGEATALVVGCGALGTVASETLTRAGVGRLVLVDRDVVEWTNLQRQMLFDEEDAAKGAAKAHAARRRLRRINSRVEIEAHAVDLTPVNAERLASNCDLILDGTDNFETRFLLNDLAVKRGLPYVYGGAVGTRGMAFTVLPRTAGGDSPWERPPEGAAETGGPGPCLRCIFGDAPPAGGETCDTVGVLGPAVAMIAQHESAEAIKLLSGNANRMNRRLISLDLWRNEHRQIDVRSAFQPGACVCCGERRFDYLEGDRFTRTTALCGRHAVQISAPGESEGRALDLRPIADRLRPLARTTHHDMLLRAEFRENQRDYRLTLFPDGRAIIHGTDDPAVAKGLYARYVGL